MDSIEFVTRVTHELETRPSAARLLWIDLPELLAVERPTIVKEVARLWRPLGVKLCLEHAGQRIGRILQLDSLGLDCIRVDGSFIRGLTGPDSVNGRRHLKSILHLASVAGLTVTAEAVSTASDLTMVWALGFDAATGPAVQQRAQSMSLQ